MYVGRVEGFLDAFKKEYGLGREKTLQKLDVVFVMQKEKLKMLHV